MSGDLRCACQHPATTRANSVSSVRIRTLVFGIGRSIPEVFTRKGRGKYVAHYNLSASSSADSNRLVLMPRLTAASVSLACLATSTRSWSREASTRPNAKALSRAKVGPFFFALVVAVETIARAATARRRSSAATPVSLTNAATSQDDNRMRVSPSFTVLIERPCDGGVAINCSQIFSMHASKSRASGGWSFCADSIFSEALPVPLDKAADTTVGELAVFFWASGPNPFADSMTRRLD